MYEQGSQGHVVDHAEPPGPQPGGEEDRSLVDLVETEQALETEHAGAGAPGEDAFLDFYRLRENPFSDSVNPAYFYKTAVHEETCIRMMLAVRHNISLALVTGHSGTGKTLVSQMILQELDPALYQPILVLVSPGMTKTSLLKEILVELGLTPPEGVIVRTQDLLRMLSDHVIELYRGDRKLVVLIDECHFLSSDSLHMVRTLSNIEVPERKLLTCLLFGEERFLRRLSHASYESLRNRMYLRSELLPLDENDTAQYVKFRLLVAGRMDPLFSDEAFLAVHRHTEGVCRRINKLCMLALVEGFIRRTGTVDEEIVHRCADQM
jgi:general secretion pathway protein A